MPKLWFSESRSWAGQTAVVIGGGSSLRDFDWTRLHGANTVGCNDAFRLGPDVCSVCLFGDPSWWQRSKWDLEKYEGRVASVVSVITLKLPWIKAFKRRDLFWGEGDFLGWWYSTGSSAVNLAVNLGAERVFLLGFDMVSSKGKSHWHNYTRPSLRLLESAFDRHITGFTALASALKKAAPQAEVLNVVMPGVESKLRMFPSVSLEEMEGELVCH